MTDEQRETRKRLYRVLLNGLLRPDRETLLDDMIAALERSIEDEVSIAFVDQSPFLKSPELIVEAFSDALDHTLQGDRDSHRRLRLAIVAMCFYVGETHLQDRQRKQRGAMKRSALVQTERATRQSWMWPLFDQAYSQLEAEDLKRIGHRRLCLEARRLAGPNHPHRAELSEHHAREYLKSHHRKKNGRVA